MKYDQDVLAKVLSACDVQSGLGLGVQVPSTAFSTYAVSSLKAFVYESGRTYGWIQSDNESSIHLQSSCPRRRRIEVEAFSKILFVFIRFG